MSTRLGGRYQLVRELGAGGMGRVFQAVDTETGRAVAAKIMLATSEDNLDALLRFQQEGALLSTLKHPNIVEVYGTFLEEHTSCIIMELLEGRSLSQILRAERLSLARVKNIAAQTTSALAYAHGRAIVHRDVKPDNIMIVGDDHVKVTDFGIARILRTGATLNTATGMSIGTPLYMAPEQIEGQKVDGRADIYSFGAVLYQMVTGQPPFEGDDPLTIAFKHVHKAPRKPQELAADIPDDWEAVILKCLSKDPGDRFQTATALHDAIQALGGGNGTIPAGSAQTEAPPRTTTPPPTGYKPDTIDKIINPEVTGGSRGGETALGPASTALGAAGETVLGPADGRQTVIGPSDNGQTGPIPGMGRGPVSPADTQAPGTVIQPSIPQYGSGQQYTPPPQMGPAIAPPPVVGPPPATGTVSAKRRPVGMMVGGALAGVLVLAGIGYGATKVLGGNGPTPTPTAVVAGTPKITFSGTKSGGQFASGSKVTINLSAQNADAYRLRVARNSAFVKAQTFALVEPVKTLSVVGAATYFVESQAKANGKWGPMSAPISFSVARPVAGKTHFVSPANGFSTTGTTIHLAWAPVVHAIGYRLSVDGHSSTVTGTSTTISVGVGKHHVTVAAEVQGVKTYAGPAASLSFAVRQKPKPKPKPTAVPPTAVPSTSSTGGVGTGTSGTGTSGTGYTGSGTSGTTGTGSTGYTGSGTSGTTGTGSTGTGSTGTSSGSGSTGSSGSSGTTGNPCNPTC